jgi:ribulose-5-phosphate 4-epimerase/fuculose-1-phosphate aldolase
MMSTTAEGVSKFTLQFDEQDCVDNAMIRNVEAWRQILWRLGLIGRSPERYDGAGYGNISARFSGDNSAGFLVSGTQTGGLPILSAKHYAVVTGWDPAGNTVTARGLTDPSSEALTHGQLYDLDDAVQCVVHAHCPEIWLQADRLQLPTTDPAALYGTPEMAREVRRVFADCRRSGQRLLVMGGHLDGVISFGENPARAVGAMIEMLALSLAQGGPEDGP